MYCYTGSFTCYAAKGAARSTVSVDRSKTAVNWARRNMALNEIAPQNHRLIQTHAFGYLSKANRERREFDLAVVDPPSFYTIRSSEDHFDIARDHPTLLKAVLTVMRKGSLIIFSTNHQNFIPFLGDLPVSGLEEITSRTIPEDYVSKHKTIHRCWKIKV